MRRKTVSILSFIGLFVLLAVSTHAQATSNTVAALGCVAPPPGLVSWWDADSVSGTTAFDIQDGNDGTLVNGATTSAGKVGQAFSLNGTSAYVVVPHNVDLNIGPAFSVDLWFKANVPQLSPDHVSLIEKSHRGPQAAPVFSGWTLQHLDSGGLLELEFRIGNGSAFSGVRTLASVLDNQWHHIAGVFDGTTVTLYLDGTILGTTAFSGTPVNNSGPLNIGRWAFGAERHFNGLIDEVEIFDRALTTAEITAIFNAGSAGKCKALIVEIDIKPGSFPNSINLGSGGNVPVAIFSSATFDATTVDPLTVTLAGATVKLKGKGTPMASSEDVDGDGLLDLVVHVSIEALQLTNGDTEAILGGRTLDGTSITGVDTVRVVP